jgi:PAS domain S-box-containing protein
VSRFPDISLDLLPDAAVVVDRLGRIVHANQRVEDVFGYDPAQLVGQPLDVLLPARFRRAHSELLARFFAVPRPRAMGTGLELVVLRADGREVPVDIMLAPLERDGEEVLALAVVRDMSERAALVEALRASQERYRQLVEGASEVFYRVAVEGDPLRGRVEFVSPQVQRLVGCDPEEFLADPSLWIECVHPDDRAPLARRTTEILQARSEGTRYYRVRHRATREIRWVADRVVPLVDAKGEVVGYQGTVRDITERVLADRERTLLEERLRKAEKMETLGRLAGGIAHDFNNIVQIIATACELAQQELGGEGPVETYLRDARGAVERARALVRQLLGFARRQVAAPVTLELSEHVRGLEAILRHALPREVRLEFSLAERSGTVHIDPSQVDQILLNLVTNARDAMPEGGTLTVAVGPVRADASYVERYVGLPPGDYVKLEVRDTGHGMDAETLARVFEPFFTTKAEGRGTGLGLATVYGIVKQNHGFVHVESEVGVGTLVVVHLPRVGA